MWEDEIKDFRAKNNAKPEPRQVQREVTGYMRGGDAPDAELPKTIRHCEFYEKLLVGDRFRILGHDFFKGHGYTATRGNDKYTYSPEEKALIIRSI